MEELCDLKEFNEIITSKNIMKRDEFYNKITEYFK